MVVVMVVAWVGVFVWTGVWWGWGGRGFGALDSIFNKKKS